MLSQQKNKIMERYRTQKDAVTERYFPDKQDKDMGNSCLDTILHGNETVVVKNSENRPSRISSCLEKHIEYLQKKLTDSETQTNKAKLYSEILEAKLQEKYSENDRLLNKITEQQKTVKQLSFKYQMLLSDHQNLKLKHKMEKLHRQINEQQETQSQIQLKNKQLKQGKYSASFMPSPFESPNKTFEQKTEKNQTILDNLSNPSMQKSMKSSPKQKNPINSHLVEEYQKLKHDKAKKQKQILQLRAQNNGLKSQLDAKSKQHSKLVYERSSKSVWLNNELTKCKSKLQQQKRQNKMLFDKLKSTEMKMIQLSELVKNSQNIDQYKMREYSDMSDVRRILEDDKDRLLQESIITDLIPTKYEKHSQTDHINPELKETDKIQHYITKIASLKSEMLERTQQYNKTEQQYRNKLGQQLRRSNQLVEHYREKAQKAAQDDRGQQKVWKSTELTILDSYKSNNQVRQNCSNKQVKQMQVQCLLIASDILLERSYILEKAKIFIDFNEEQKKVIQALNQQKNQLQQLSQQQNHKNTTLQMESSNFSNIYGQLRSDYDKLQAEFNAETQKLNCLLADKQTQLENYFQQLEAASRQFDALNQTIAQYQQRVSYYQKQIEKYQLKMEICNQRIDALRQNT